MSGWLTFAGVFALFFTTHSIPVRPTVKQHLVKHLGSKGFTAAYSVLSLSMLALLIWAAQRAPFVPIWDEAPWHRHVVWVGMFVACLIFAVSIGRPNPFSFGGWNNDTFDPARPGLIGYLRHPLLSALALWAILHLLVNGDLAHVLLFGVLAFFALVGHRIVDMRQKRVLGCAGWAALWSEVRKQRRPHFPSRNFIFRVFAAVLIYLILVSLHPIVIGRAVFL